MRHVDAGLFGLGLRLDSDQSVFHELSARLPSGMFDGHSSVIPSPDHLFFIGLSKLLLQAIVTLLTPDLRPTLGDSFRESLAHTGLPCTKVYNASNKMYVNSLGISECAAVCIIGPHACRRATPDALLTEPVTGTSPLGVAVDLLKDFYDVVRLASLYPRAELDGEAACMDRDGAAVELRRRAAVLLRSIRAACARPDCATLAASFDSRSIHRMSEAAWHAVQLLGSIRDAFELLFESMHQPLKHSIRSGNGHDDVRRAMTKMMDNEIVSRLAMEPSKFSLPRYWLQHASLRKLCDSAVPLPSSLVDSKWTAGHYRQPEADVPIAAKLLVAGRVAETGHVSWPRHTVRGGVAIRPTDTVVVLVASGAGVQDVHVARVGEEGEPSFHVSFFRVVAIWVASDGQPSSVVSQFACAAHGAWKLDESRVLHLPMGHGVRRALTLHDCTSACSARECSSNLHDSTNSGVLCGREQGYPPRQGETKT